MSDNDPPMAALPRLNLHPSLEAAHVDATKVVNDWLSNLTESLTKGHLENASSLFLEEESWWRDMISFTWDIACHNGAEAICKYISASEAGGFEPRADQPGALQPQLVDMGGLYFIQSGFSFKTNFGVGRGVLRLANVGPHEWRAWTVFTVLESLHEELQQETETDDGVQVLVVGAGHSGLQIGAHLQQLGLKYLIVDKATQSGNSWRNRYSSIKSHTPSWLDHYPFMKYPADWPRYLDQEHITTWMERYANDMGLKIKFDTLVSKVNYDESTQQYSVELRNKDHTEIVNPKHVVLATGLFSDIMIRPTFPGEDSFKGEIYHASAHKYAASIPNVQNKKVTIIGSGTSAHDIAQDFVNAGVKTVVMVQRGPIYVTALETQESFLLQLWDTPGLSTEDADLLGCSMPTAVARALSAGAAPMMAAKDKALLDGLERAGQGVKRGCDGDSLVEYQLLKGGHFYIDQGACEMIIDGRIQIQRCEEGVQDFYHDGIQLANGTKIESDLVVLATGYERGAKAVEHIMGKDVMEKVGDLFGLDDGQERISTWRPTGMPGFWFTTGSFVWSRQFSPVLALQIAAMERGLNG